MASNVRVSESTELFVHKVQNLYVEITKHIQTNNVQYKLQVDLHRWHNKFNVGDYVMIRFRPKRYLLGSNQKLQVHQVGLFKVLQRVSG
jgi:hypothetical protein